MKALTIWQPWASLIMIGAKPYEFRGRSYLAYRGCPKVGERIVIHAGARPMKWAEVSRLRSECEAGGKYTGLIIEKALPLLDRLTAAYKCHGVIPEGFGLGTAVLGRPRNAREIYGHLPADSDRGEFNWAWPMEAIEPFAEPIHCRGMQGFWIWPSAASAFGMEAA